MSPDSNRNIHAIENIRKLRLAGQLGPALEAVTKALAEHPGDAVTMGEAIRLLTVAGKTETALRLHDAFSSIASKDNALEPELLARLALQMGRTDLLGDLPPVEQPTWLMMFQENKEDPLRDLQLGALTIQVSNGPSVYEFQGPCPYCGHLVTTRVNVNLLVSIKGVCPACFGAHRLDYRIIRQFVMDRHADLLEPGTRQTDLDLNDHLREKLMEPGKAPPIIRLLGQEYHFLLNGIMANRHLKHMDQEGTGKP